MDISSYQFAVKWFQLAAMEFKFTAKWLKFAAMDKYTIIVFTQDQGLQNERQQNIFDNY